MSSLKTIEVIRTAALDAATAWCPQYTPTRSLIRTAASFEEYIVRGYDAKTLEAANHSDVGNTSK